MRDDAINKTALIPIVIPSYEPDDRLIALLEDFNAKDMGPVIIVNDGSSEEYDPIFKKAEELMKNQKFRDEARKEAENVISAFLKNATVSKDYKIIFK